MVCIVYLEENLVYYILWIKFALNLPRMHVVEKPWNLNKEFIR